MFSYLHFKLERSTWTHISSHQAEHGVFPNGSNPCMWYCGTANRFTSQIAQYDYERPAVLCSVASTLLIESCQRVAPVGLLDLYCLSMSKSSSENNDDPPEVGSQWFPCELKKSILATGYKRPEDFMRFQVINTRDLANFHLVTWSKIEMYLKMIHNWSSLIYHWYIQVYHFECIFHGANVHLNGINTGPSCRTSNWSSYMVGIETHIDCWMVINPCFIRLLFEILYIYMAMYLLFHRVSTHIYIYTYSGFCFCFFLFIWDGWPWPILYPILYCQRTSNTEGVEDPTAKELFGDMGQEPQWSWL